ncbi:MAG: PQQ-binding-like beta-propeller repeat protein [Dehalococcoidia bacterium]
MTFHVKHRRRWLLVPLVLAIPIIAACRIQNDPDGWAAPLSIGDEDDRQVLIVRTDDDHLARVSVDLTTDPATVTTIWEFPGSPTLELAGSRTYADDEFPGLVDEIGASGFYGTPALLGPEGEELIVGDYDEGVVYALRTDGTSARIIFETDDRVIAGVLVDEDRRTAYIATADNRVIAVDTEKPEASLWTFDESGEAIWGTPALADSRKHGRLLIVPSLDGNVYALRTDPDVADHERLAWKFETGAGIASSVVVQDGRAFVGGFDRTFYAIDLDSGTEVWRRSGSNWFWTTALVDGGIVYVGDLDGKVWAWDAETGAPVWEAPYDANDRIRAQPLLVEERALLVIVTRSGEIHALDAATGEVRWNSGVKGVKVESRVLADPVLLGSIVLVNNDDGRLFEVRVGAQRLRRLQEEGRTG